jgi:hypothetical protein
MDASAAVAKIIGLILDYRKTGRFPGWEPTPDDQLAAAELIEKVMPGVKGNEFTESV